MTALEQLNRYLKDVELRLRIFAASRGAAVTMAWALALTVVLVWISNRYKFADGIVLPMRILLFATVAAAIAFALVIPVARLNRRRVTRLAEARAADFKERLLTVTERPDPANPFTEIIAEDALRVAQAHKPEAFVSRSWLYGSCAVAAGCLAVLIWMIAAGPGYWGYGASLLWTGSARAASRPLYDITVQPGNKTIRRKSDQLITARLIGFSSREITLHTKYTGSLKWEQVAMQEQQDGNGYQFLFAGVSDPVEYYVQAGDAASKHFTLGVKDLPAVKRIRVALHFPSGIGLKDVVQDAGGDIRAVEGTQADISVLTDRPLDHGVLVLENGSRIQLTKADGNWLTARLPINKDGSYHVAAIDSGETIRISDDYFIEARKDEPPTVKISRPGHDPRVSPIEEVPITVEATDDFGVDGLDLHYSVNGGPEQTVSLLKSKGVKEAEGKTTLYLENFKLVPGDLVSLYATARDANKASKSDMVFAQAEAFDYKFRQSQSAGGAQGGGTMEEQNNISERQKEIIAATWNQMKDGGKEHAAVVENARFLSDLEGKLSDQAKALAERMGNRELVSASEQFGQFSKAMNEASGEMVQAVEQLKPAKWHDALPPEQKALQSLLRAESIFRDIQVAFGQNAGGGMGMSGANRDLARLFDLELDTSKNQYETGQSPSASTETQRKQLDEALQKLQELARRQQELADQRTQQQNFQQRWEEEQLRREAEQLRQQMQQLAQNQSQQQQGQLSQSGQQSQQQQSSSSSSSSSASSSSSSSASSADARSIRQNQNSMREAAQALQRAEEEMRKAVSNQDATARQRAADQLAQLQQKLQSMLAQQAGNSVGDLAQKAQQLANAQKELADRIKQQYGAQGINTNRTDGASSAEMPEMTGPGYAGYGFRRRFGTIPEPTRSSTDKEKALAAEGEKLAQQVRQLQQQTQQQAQSIAGQQPDATKKLRQALSDAEQQELALRMQKSSQWLRDGYGEQTWPMQDSITAGMQQLSRQLQEAQQALGKGGGTQPGDQTARALEEIRGLRDQIAGGNPTIGGGTREVIDDLSALARRDRELRNYANDAIGYIRHLQGQAGLLDARISKDAVASLQRLEVELGRRLGQDQTGSARTGAREDAPEQYRDAVAEYFRRLSK